MRGKVRPSQARGFTLVELLVVVALIVLITAAVLVRQARFDSSTLLRSLSYSVALSVRQAQVYGTSIVGVQSGATKVYASAYGIYFNGPDSYAVYADINSNGTYDSATDVLIQAYQMGAGYQITKFCGIKADRSQNCSVTWLSVYFKRPNPDALFADSAGDTLTGAYIQIASTNDAANTRSITVTSTGQISVGGSGS